MPEKTEDRSTAQFRLNKIYDSFLNTREQVRQRREIVHDNASNEFWDKVEGASERNALKSEKQRRMWDFFFYDRYQFLTKPMMYALYEAERSQELNLRNIENEVLNLKNNFEQSKINEGDRNKELIDEAKAKSAQEVAKIESESAVERKRISEGESSQTVTGILSFASLLVDAIIFFNSGWAGIGIAGFLILFTIRSTVQKSLDEARLRITGFMEQAERVRSTLNEEIISVEKALEHRLLQIQETFESQVGDISKKREELIRASEEVINDVMHRIKDIEATTPPPVSSDDVVNIVDEFKSSIVEEAIFRCGIRDKDADLVHDAIDLWAPYAYQKQFILDGSEVHSLSEDRKNIYGNVEDLGESIFVLQYVTIIAPTPSYIARYSAVCDLIEWNIHEETVEQYFYSDIVSLSTQASVRNLQDEARSAQFGFSLSSGESTEIDFENDRVFDEMLKNGEQNRREQVDELLAEMETLCRREEDLDQSSLSLAKSLDEIEKSVSSLKSRVLGLMGLSIINKPPVGVTEKMLVGLRATIQDRKAALGLSEG